MRKFLPIVIILLLGTLFLVIIQFGSQGGTAPPPIPYGGGQGTQLEIGISGLKQKVYSEEDYSRVSATLGASLSTKEIAEEEHRHLNSLLNMAKCSSLVLLFDSLRSVDCANNPKLLAVVTMMKQQRSVVTIPDMENRLSQFSEIQSFENVVNKVRVAMSMEFDPEAVDQLKNELNTVSSLSTISNCSELMDVKYTYAKCLVDFPSAAQQAMFNLNKGSFPSGTTMDFVRPFGFYFKKLEDEFRN